MALRKFDGAEEAPRSRAAAPKPRSWAGAWSRRPALQAFAAAGLVAVVSIPLAQTVIRETVIPREQPQDPAYSPPPSVSVPRACEGAGCAPSETAGSADAQADVAASPSADTTAPARETPPARTARVAASDAAKPMRREGSDALAPAPAAVVPPQEPMAPSAPPPPPPPAPEPQFAEQPAYSEITVTGARIARPRVSSPSAVQTMGAAAPQPANAAGVFLSRLQSAFRSGDRRAIIALVALPLRVESRTETRLYRSAQEIERDFDRVFTPQVRQSVLRATPDRLSGAGPGLSGTGKIWFGPACPNPSCSPPGAMRIRQVTLQ